MVGGAPLLDIQNVVQRRVVTRDVIDAVPTGNKSWAAMAMLVPGAKISGGANVGGTTSSQAAATIHGSRIQDSLMLHDGLRYNQGLGSGGGRNALTANDGAVEQIGFETAALGAESEVGGFVHNIIPKDGGNRFAGSFAADYSGRSFQADNLSDELRSRARRTRRTRFARRGTSTRPWAARLRTIACGSSGRSGTGVTSARSPTASST